jgi:type II secretory pathway pseudopilin PulG
LVILALNLTPACEVIICSNYQLQNYKFRMKISLRFRGRRSSQGEEGYILITLILFVALLAIAMTAMAPVITQQIKRDREEELIHRGVQYSRAIQHYVKKFSRYPTKIEDLENTNNVRFLRKRYKDPITGKDFKLLHLGEVQASFGPGIAGATSVASMAATSQAGGAFGNSGFGNNSAFGGSNFGNSGSTFGGGNSGSSFGGSSFGSFGSSGNSPQSSGSNPNQANQGKNTGTDASSADQPVSGQSGVTDSGNNKVFGGGPIVGVASISKEKSIRVFNKKNHYNEWQFIYNPSSDTGGLLTTPNQPGLQSAGAGMQQGMQGQTGTQSSGFGSQGSAFGQGSSFGQSSSFGNMSPGGMQSAPSQAQQPPQSQFPPDQAPQQ